MKALELQVSWPHKSKRQSPDRRPSSLRALCPEAKSASRAAACVRQRNARPAVRFGDVDGSVVISSEQFIVARVPEGAASGNVVVATNGHRSNPHEVQVAVPIAESLHPVANPAVDASGNIYATFSGSRGQKVPVAIYRIDTGYNVKPFVTEMMNPTGLAFGQRRQPVRFFPLRRYRVPRRHRTAP